MIHPQTRLRFADSVDKAKIQAKRDFHAYCIVTGLSPEHRPLDRKYGLDGAHVFSSSNFPELSKCVENILPIIHYRHSWRSGFEIGDEIKCLDLVDGFTLSSDRVPLERIRWIAKHTHAEFRTMVFYRLKLLLTDGCLVSQRVRSMSSEALEIIGGAE